MKDKSYKIISKFSNDLTENEWIEIKDSFNLIFKKKNEISYFKQKYCLNPLGFSCHGILYKNTKIVGCFTIIPRSYIVFGKKKLIGVGCDAFILKKHRINAHFLKLMSESIYIKIPIITLLILYHYRLFQTRIDIGKSLVNGKILDL